MAGYGNHTAPDYGETEEHATTRLGLTDSKTPYSDGHEKHGSGTTGGAGFGNKTGSFSSSSKDTDFHFTPSNDSVPYSGGAGFGNKTGSFDSSSTGDSTVGKVLQKAGHVVHSAKIESMGRDMRDKQAEK